MKKKTTKAISPTSEYDSQRETKVLLEEMNKGIKTIGEQHGTIVKRFDNIDSQLNSVKMAVMEVDAKVSKLNTKLDTNISQNEERFKRIETKLEIV